MTYLSLDYQILVAVLEDVLVNQFEGAYRERGNNVAYDRLHA